MEHITAKCGEPEPNTVLVSSAKKWGFHELLEMIGRKLSVNSQPADFRGEF